MFITFWLVINLIKIGKLWLLLLMSPPFGCLRERLLNTPNVKCPRSLGWCGGGVRYMWGHVFEGRGRGEGIRLRGNERIWNQACLVECNLCFLSVQLIGPLTMHPAAEDNYGQDACSILCLHTQPPVVAMATANGKIYHCIVLESEDQDQSMDGALVIPPLTP